MFQGFKKFIMLGNIVDLGIAVVIGVSFGAVVTALVADFITPLIAALFGQNDFSSLTFTINQSVFRYGHFINSIISFFAVSASIYFIVVVPKQKLAERRKTGQEVPSDSPTPSDEVVLLKEIRDVLVRNANK
ncbi:MAG: large conductance mechanosensitive channel protein MscL [Acidimicrobiaceae bacterium]|nr:large conductance mechanosensitive channel protein MscL [Acidimicrobiaceae bacterium]